MKPSKTLFAALVAGLAIGSVQAQTRWNMPCRFCC